LIKPEQEEKPIEKNKEENFKEQRDKYYLLVTNLF